MASASTILGAGSWTRASQEQFQYYNSHMRVLHADSHRGGRVRCNTLTAGDRCAHVCPFAKTSGIRFPIIELSWDRMISRGMIGARSRQPGC
jgi:hypothetical protein